MPRRVRLTLAGCVAFGALGWQPARSGHNGAPRRRRGLIGGGGGGGGSGPRGRFIAAVAGDPEAREIYTVDNDIGDRPDLAGGRGDQPEEP